MMQRTTTNRIEKYAPVLFSCSYSQRTVPRHSIYK